MSFWQRISTDAKNAANDVYSHWIIGDDAGKSALTTLLYKPSSEALGMTFIEINHRAYVKSVAPDSAACLAGVLPQDAVQLAVPIRREWEVEAIAEMASDIDDNENDDDDPCDEDNRLRRTDRVARAYGLRLERKGARTSYNHLLRLLTRRVLHGDPQAVKQHFLSPPSKGNGKKKPTLSMYKNLSHEANYSMAWDDPPIPSTICAPIINEPDSDEKNNAYLNFDRRRSSSTENSDYDETHDSEPPSSILFIFRRTRQRHSSEASCFIPASFRLDDECDLACSLIRRLAPTADMEAPLPDTWEELVHDGTDWLLGHQSMLPPKNGAKVPSIKRDGQEIMPPTNSQEFSDSNSPIPLDAFEQVRAKKLAALRSRMTAETMLVDRTEDVESATVRAMIQKAVGLAFVRASKVVLGVSIHGGSGIVISRLSDGTWSAPSAIGTWGLGLGLQFGLEVAEYIFILQTQEAMQHFKRGGSYTVGGNMGVAIGGLGREAYGAASVGGGGCGTDTTSGSNRLLQDEDYNDENDDSRDGGEQKRATRSPQSLGIAPIVAYAKSQGLYVGVSLEGSRIFTRNDINCRTYKFSSGRNVTANDILSGKVPTPPEAEELYAALHSVEFTHEMSRLPRPPEVLRKDSANAWTYDRSITVQSNSTRGSPDPSLPTGIRQSHPFAFFTELSTREIEECTAFEAQFKNFLYGGVSVQRLITDIEGCSDRTGKERRTLWLMLPEIGSLRLGFVSKLSDGDGAVSNKSSTQRARRDDSSRSGFNGEIRTVGSEDLTLDSALQTKDDSSIGPSRQGKVLLSESHSVALTDVVMLSQEPLVQIKFKGEDKTQHLRVISIQDVSGAILLFLANNFREAELLVCGLKLLLERESARLGVRGGLPISALGGRNIDGAMSPAAARGFREISSSQLTSSPELSTRKPPGVVAERSRQSIIENAAERKLNRWGTQPGRDYMRGQAYAASDSTRPELIDQTVPRYVHGQAIVKGIAKNVCIPLPIPLCRVLLLDSTSPVIKQWQKERGDENFDHSQWYFPPSTPRELERHSSEHQLIASGSMSGAQRTASFDRPRYGSLIRLSETYSVDTDDPKKISISIAENSPRRGFSVNVKIFLRATKDNLCDAGALVDVRPVGKDMSNQVAVHKAYHLVLDEIKLRYGVEGRGLLACFLSVVDDMAASREKPNTAPVRDSLPRSSRRSESIAEEKKSDHQSSATNSSKFSGLVSFEDMLKTGRESPEIAAPARPETPGLNQQIPDPNPAKRIVTKLKPISDLGEFAAVDAPAQTTSRNGSDSVLIEVKPLPKIRLALMPSPREEDEENSSSASPFPSKPTKKKKKKASSTSKSTSKHSSSRLSSGDLKRR